MLLCSICCWHEPAAEQIINLPVISDAIFDPKYPKAIYPTQSYHDLTPTQENGQRRVRMYNVLDRHYLKSVDPTRAYHDLAPIKKNCRHPIPIYM